MVSCTRKQKHVHTYANLGPAGGVMVMCTVTVTLAMQVYSATVTQRHTRMRC
jgi:hypothetical protein